MAIFTARLQAMNHRAIAYFSMEIALIPEMPTYAGGLGVLAGDTVLAAADQGLPMLAISLLHRKGYLRQRFNASGWQREEPVDWQVEDHLEELPQRVSIAIEGRAVVVRAWKREITGVGGATVPVFFLDTDLPENKPWDRTLTHYLYGGDAFYRICQEVVLGIGGIRMLRSLGFTHLNRYHMNEGHAALLGMELLDECARAEGRSTFSAADVETVRAQCVFTTHTPIEAGHDKFPIELARRVLGRPELAEMKDVFCCDHQLNMTYLALNLSHYVNGVAKSHARTSQLMFARYQVDAITNGVHAATWTSTPFRALFDRYIPGWCQDNFSLRFAHGLPDNEVWSAHQEAKRELISRVNAETRAGMDGDTFTIGFARRATSYKRTDLLVSDVARLKAIAAHAGRIQIIYGGKAHPNDQTGKELIQRIIQTADSLRPEVGLVYLANYDLSLARLLTAGVDLWLNTPEPPLEASGTSGMKAALNGVPSLSVLDGWWIEGWIEDQTGWSIGERHNGNDSYATRYQHDAESLYQKLEHVILPRFYQERARYTSIMRHCISLNGSFFNTQRMLQQYVTKAYLL
jgi:glycogen phosphorylase